MDAREQRGLQLAATKHIRKKGAVWVVPSGSDPEARYTVDPATGFCTCPDHETRRVRCKHLYAVAFTIQRETDAQGQTTVTETVTVVKVSRKTYKQDWPAYNAAQTHEKRLVASLLFSLCSGVPTPPQKGRGNRRHRLSDVIFAAAMKVYGCASARRSQSDLDGYVASGYLTKRVAYNSIFDYLEDATVEPILVRLIEESANPLAAIERDFAADSTGFSTSCFDRWYDQKYGDSSRIEQRKFLKGHVFAGVKTHIVVSVKITDGDSHDSPQLPGLLDAATAPGRFKPVEVSADKGYLSRANLEAIQAKGATPYVVFKANSTEGKADDLWRKMYHFYSLHRDEFLTHYHKRSNVESVFSMLKAKFGGSVRSKLDAAQRNEILLKILCHNLCVLVQSIYELGLEPTFWPVNGVGAGAEKATEVTTGPEALAEPEEWEGVW